MSVYVCVTLLCVRKPRVNEGERLCKALGGLGGNSEEFSRVSRVSAGKSAIPSPLSKSEARIIREFLEKEGP